MKNSYQFVRKSYAMQRMAESIERAIRATTSVEKERAARWAAAWGVLCGIMMSTVNVRRSSVDIHELSKTRRASDHIDHPARVISATASAQLRTAVAGTNLAEPTDYAMSARRQLQGDPSRHESQQRGDGASALN